MSKETTNVMLGLLTGVAVGIGAGVLFAPDKGIKTRKKIKNKVVDAKKDITKRVSHAKEEISEVIHSKKTDFEEKLEEKISKMSLKADAIIVNLEQKLEDLRKKNAHLQKN